MLELGVDYISAWQIRNLKDRVDSELSPLESELDRMEEWIMSDQHLDDRIRLLRENSEHNPKKKYILFPDRSLTDTWCNSL